MVKIMSFLRSAVYVNIMTVQMTFFSVYAMLGLTYGGMTESNIYKYVLLTSSLSCYLFILHDIITLRKLKRQGLIFLLIPFGVLFIFLASGTFTIFTNKVISLFLLLVVPSMLIGYIVAVTKEINILKIGFNYVSILIAFGILRSLNTLVSTNVIDLISIYGGGHYQALSYFSAFGFSSILCKYLFYKSNKSWYSNVLYISALLIFIAGVILSGGRGGAVVIILCTIILMYVKYDLKKIIFKYFVIIFIGSVMLVQIQTVDHYDRISESSSRLFSYISGDGIDLSQTSNRNEFYDKALLYIKENWLFGYGPFTYVKKTGDFYSHNIFLDILLHGGVIYLSIWLIVFIRFFKKLNAILKESINEIFILIPIVSSFVLLMFSGTYLEENMFWFSLSYVFSYNIEKNVILDQVI